MSRTGGEHPEAALSSARLRLGIVCGLLAVLTYTMTQVASLPLTPTLLVVCSFGPFLAIGCAGLYELLRLHRRTATLDIALVANIAAGVAVTMMFLAQLGLKEWLASGLGGSAQHIGATVSGATHEPANGIQLGLDVAWDVFLAIGTAAFAWNMRDHPRFGWIFAGSGLVIAVALLALNLSAFPQNPGDAGLIDVGPLVGLWYLGVTVRMAQSLHWAETAVVGVPGRREEAGTS